MSMKTVEFFSGIGGWSYSLANLSDKFEVIEAFDINPIANQVYKLNHGLVPNHKSIEHVTAKHLNSLQADMWVMSPPCQPHTRNNTTDTRDDNDPRSNAFIKLMTLLQEMTPPPRYIALENVVGFEDSSCCDQFLDILDSLRYRFQQYHLTPTQFGVPNARPRYYLIAALGGATPACRDTLPGACSRVEGVSVGARTVHSSLYPHGDRQPPLTPLATYLDLSMSAGETAELVVPAAVLAKSASWCFDIIPLPRAPVSVQQVGSESAAASTPTAVAACFTKGYSRYIRGAGSVLLIDDSAAAGAAVVEAVAPEERVYRSDWREELCLGGAAAGAATEVDAGPGAESTPAAASVVSALAAEGGRRLRYFSPRELLNLFGFPPRCRFNAPSSSSAALESQPLPAASGTEPAVVGNGGDAQGDIQGGLKGKGGGGNKRVKVCPQKPVTRRQCYELIGNSINVTMTTRLLEHMFKMYPPDMPITMFAKNTN